MKYEILVHPDPESGMFLVDVPDLPGVITEGHTEQQAVENASRAIRAHLQFLREQGHPVPEPTHRSYAIAV